ncbi:MAG: hypothetical protein LQ342_001794 [Letrouitia transgressa]|nr:MAG: hypothetical protein LQ342_001794 [Letrouitia transgressa]
MSAEQEDGRTAQDSERELTRLWRAWRTIQEMCADRGYELAEEEVRISLDEFHDKFTDPNGIPDRKKMNFSARPTAAMMAKHTPISTPKDPAPAPQIGTVWVEFASDASIGIKQMRAFVHHISEHKFHTGIMVTRSSITSAALKIKSAIGNNQHIETFQEQDLLVNITHHELVPKHVLLSAEEKKKLLERYRLKETQLPRIQVTDPVARYLGLKRGNVVKIIRRSETAGRYASYRWAI